MTSLRNSRILAVAARGWVVIIFVALAGIAIGVAGDRAMEHRRMMSFIVGGRVPKGPPPEARRWVLSRLQQELKLSPSQHNQVDSVLARREADVRALMVEMRPRFEAISERTRRDIQAALTPDQQKHFNEMREHAGTRPEH